MNKANSFVYDSSYNKFSDFKGSLKMLDQILMECKEYRKNLKRRATWNDYEYFKNKLWQNNLYGFESKIANILKI